MKYQCHGCGTIYDVKKGMPIRCCDKVIRHQYIEGKIYNYD